MKKLWLSERMISYVFWRELGSSLFRDEALSDSKNVARITAPLVEKFPSIAGSISVESGMYLWLLMKYFSPKQICEVGTYIGRSTLAMACGGTDSIEKIYTCDGTYDCMSFEDLDYSMFSAEKLNSVKKIEYFGNTMSTTLLQKLQSQSILLDLIFIDGRIGTEDCQVLTKVCSEDCIFILDDFDGVEKGVVNAAMLRGVFKGHILLEPPLIKEKQVPLNLAILVPTKILTLSRQQTLPVQM